MILLRINNYFEVKTIQSNLQKFSSVDILYYSQDSEQLAKRTMKGTIDYT